MFMHNTPDVIVLCGGAGLRLRSVTGNIPKVMATVSGRPFMELLLRQLERNSFRRVILAVGYQKEMIKSFFGERFGNLELIYSDESQPLGTGGALRNAAPLLTSEEVLVMNGDSYTGADLMRFVRHHREVRANLSMLVVPADGRSDCGTVLVGPGGKILLFGEKATLDGARYINAGIYVLSRQTVDQLPERVQISLEHELFPRWLEDGIPLEAFIHQGQCLDIGTPDRYHGSQELLRDAEAVSKSTTTGVQQ